jgi:SRSO17 transposase
MLSAGTVARWTRQLDALHERIARHFVRPEPRRRGRAYLETVLGGAERRNGWQLAEAAGEATPYGMQRLIASASWDADAVRDDLRVYVVEHLGDPGGVLIVDETGFLKKGDQSAGVQRQYSGTAGRIDNCQVGGVLAYASARGHAFLDRELYLPAEWCADRPRGRVAGVPDAVPFRTKPALAREMLERALDAGVPAAWVTADEVYGGHRRLRIWLEERGQPFVLAVKASEPLFYFGIPGRSQPQAATIAAALPPDAWHVLSAGAGSKGPRAYRWAWTELSRIGWPGWRHALLVRERLTPNERGEYERAYYVVFAPGAAMLADVVRVAGARWAIEQGFESAKQEVGLDEYEVRKYDGWYRYITLALFAHAFLAVVRADAAPRQTRKRGSRRVRPARSARPRSSR